MKKKIGYSFCCFLIILSLGGCGFKLNRQQPALPRGAKLLAFGEVQNQTFFPGLDMRVKQNLATQFGGEKNIRIVPLYVAEQVLSIQIKNNAVKKMEYSLEEGGLIEFEFHINAQYSLLDAKSQTFIFKEIPISGTYHLKKNQSTDLDEFETHQGTLQASENLSEAIFRALTSEF